MGNYIITLIGFLTIFLIDLPLISRKNGSQSKGSKKVTLAYGIILSLAILGFILFLTGKNMPNFLVLITRFYENVLHLCY